MRGRGQGDDRPRTTGQGRGAKYNGLSTMGQLAEAKRPKRRGYSAMQPSSINENNDGCIDGVEVESGGGSEGGLASAFG